MGLANGIEVVIPFAFIKKKEELVKLQKQINETSKFEDKDINISFDLETYDDEVIKSMENILKELPKDLTTSFTIYFQNAKITCSDLEKFAKLQDSFSENNKLFFAELFKRYTLDEVVNAQKQIDDFTNKIKNLDASPFEKYLIIYDFVTNKIYKENKEFEYKSRDIISILNGDDIVCVGYASILSKLCMTVGIECYEQSCKVSAKNGVFKEGHANNIVKIKDDKYGIDGAFYADPCWDSIKEDKKRTYTHCLLPLKDKDKFRGINIKVDNDKQFLYNNEIESVLCYMGLNDLEDFKIDYKIDEQNEDVREFFIDEDRRKLACERLKKILKENNIPADLFANGKIIPQICSIQRMLALCMEDNIDEKRMQESLQVLNKMKGLGDGFDCRNERMQPDYSYVNDIYETIDEFSKFENSIEINYSYFDELEDINSNSDEEISEKFLTKEFPSEWKSISFNYSKIQKEREIKQHIKEFIGDSKSISLSLFKKALIRSYELRGMDQQKANKVAGESIYNSIDVAGKTFHYKADNCFSITAQILMYEERLQK